MKIETEQQLEEAVATYEDMMAELQPLLWQRDELLKAIETAVVTLKHTVITDSFVYAYSPQNSTNHEEAVRLAGVPQADIDKNTTVTIKLSRAAVDAKWLKEIEEAGAQVSETTAWSKIKTPKAIRDKVTTEAAAKMKVGAK